MHSVSFCWFCSQVFKF